MLVSLSRLSVHAGCGLSCCAPAAGGVCVVVCDTEGASGDAMAIVVGARSHEHGVTRVLAVRPGIRKHQDRSINVTTYNITLHHKTAKCAPSTQQRRPSQAFQRAIRCVRDLARDVAIEASNALHASNARDPKSPALLHMVPAHD